MSRRVWKSSAAAADIVECATYLGQTSPAAADRFLDAVERGIDLLADMPGLGAVYDTRNPRLKGVRIWQVKGFEKYLVFYREMGPNESRSSASCMPLGTGRPPRPMPEMALTADFRGQKTFFGRPGVFDRHLPGGKIEGDGWFTATAC